MSRVASKIYVPLDVSFFDDARMVDAGERAQYLYLAMLAKAKGLDSDGILTRQQIARLTIPGWQTRLKDLERVGAVVVDGEEVAILAWLNWNESADARKERLAKDRLRKAEKGTRS